MKRVLIVEDSPAMRQLIALTVQRVPGVHIDEAGDGMAALKALKDASGSPYDLIFLDINMPVMDGIKLLGRIREDQTFSETIVAVITMAESSETERQARALGARYFVRKPVTRALVEEILTEALGLELR